VPLKRFREDARPGYAPTGLLSLTNRAPNGASNLVSPKGRWVMSFDSEGPSTLT